jgi:hypothetical protein
LNFLRKNNNVYKIIVAKKNGEVSRINAEVKVNPGGDLSRTNRFPQDGLLSPEASPRLSPGRMIGSKLGGVQAPDCWIDY